jgi:hypothetical protein
MAGARLAGPRLGGQDPLGVVQTVATLQRMQ